MDDFFLRQAESSDMPAIRSLVRAVRINPTGLNWQHFIIAVTEGNEILGCGQVKTHRDGSRELASIAVVESARGLGIARAIIERLLSEHKDRPLFLMCRASLQSLYDKFGFHTAGMVDLPVYFRRIKRIERFLNANSPATERLLVMRLDD